MRRVLIVDESETIVRNITEGCFAEDCVMTCADGDLALTYLTEFMPEILIINMSLPFKDGLEVLREAAYLPRRIIAFSFWSNPWLLRVLGLLGVQYVLYMPSARGVRQALENMEKKQTNIRADLRGTVLKHLHQLGFNSNLDGFQMLAVGLPLFFSDPKQQLTKELYPAISCALESGNGQTVERSIRQAIHNAWQQRNDSIWEQYFSRDAKGEIRNPSNKKFLSALVTRLQQEMEGEDMNEDPANG